MGFPRVKPPLQFDDAYPWSCRQKFGLGLGVGFGCAVLTPVLEHPSRHASQVLEADTLVLQLDEAMSAGVYHL